MVGEGKTCDVCNLYFKNQRCYEGHLKKGKCLCHRYKCKDCGKLYYSGSMPKSRHVCGRDVYCGKCGSYKVRHEINTFQDLIQVIIQVEFYLNTM